MGKICAVPGCNIGTSEDLRQKQINQVRKCSMFQVPKDVQLRKVWSEEFGKEFKITDRICELHFNREDLYVDDDVIVINGEKIVSVRQRVILKKNSRPRRNEVKTEGESEFCVSKISRNYSTKLPQATTEKVKSSDVSQDRIEFSNSIISQQFEDFDPSTRNNDDAQMDVEYSIGNDIINSDSDNINGQMSTTDRAFGISNLVEILTKSHLRQNWAWGEKDGDIFFSLFDLNALTIRCYLQVHSDMTVTVFLCDKQKLVNFTGITLIGSFEDVTVLLRRLEDQKLCLGTGLSQNGRSETCAITNTVDRCSFCCKEKLKFEKHRLSIEDKHKPLVKSYGLLKKKSEYYRKRLKEARESIAKLENDIDNAEANARNKLLERLPNIQREIVGMFVKFAGLEKNCIRYDYDWISECLVIYAKSYSLYEYMRERGILPLPSPSTLRTQQKTLSILAEDTVEEPENL